MSAVLSFLYTMTITVDSEDLIEFDALSVKYIQLAVDTLVGPDGSALLVFRDQECLSRFMCVLTDKSWTYKNGYLVSGDLEVFQGAISLADLL